jgi:hypothetical protein
VHHGVNDSINFTCKNSKMKYLYRFLIFVSFILGSETSPGQVVYSDYFTDNALRFDFLFAGNNHETKVYPVQIKMESTWAGSRKVLEDQSGLGNFRYRILDEKSGVLLFSMGFSALFQEWQTTAEAKKTERTYYQAIFFPYPKQKVVVKIECRDRQGVFQPLYETVVDPGNYFIQKDRPNSHEMEMIAQNGKPENKVDLLFLAEGYDHGEKVKFFADVKRLSDELFKVSPYAGNEKRFNLVALFTPSEESGVDIPGESIYKNTVFNSTFYTFDLNRYLTTSDMKSCYDAAASVPWDFLVVLVNTPRYGGGGVYNQVTVCSSGNNLSPKVFVHELSHAFAGLADEYYTSEVAYEDFYNLSVEPWEPNITTMVDFSSKWKSLIDKNTPVPTPRSPEYKSVTGVFEGGGYMAKGIYSPMQDCRMKSNVSDQFCPACSAAIQRAIDRYSDK